MFAHPEWLVSRLLFVGLVVEAIELFNLRRAFADGGLFSRSTLAILMTGAQWHTRAGATIGGSRAVTVALVGQATAALAVIVAGLGTGIGILAAVICLIANGYLRVRR